MRLLLCTEFPRAPDLESITEESVPEASTGERSKIDHNIKILYPANLSGNKFIYNTKKQATGNPSTSGIVDVFHHYSTVPSQQKTE